MHIDCHTHFVPLDYVRQLAAHAEEWHVRVTPKENGSTQIELLDPAAYFRREPLAIGEPHHSLEQRQSDMRRLSIDVQVLSPPTYLFRYDLPRSAAVESCRAYNDALIAAVQSNTKYFKGLGILPLQDPKAAVTELERIIQAPGIIGIEIGTRIGAWELDAPELWRVYEAAMAYRALILIHPSTVSSPERMQDFYLTHLVGLPSETALAAARLLLGGVLDQFPRLALCLSHAGGYFLFGLGRIDHAVKKVKAARSVARRSPEEYLSQLYFDSVAHGKGVLEFVVSQVGSKHVLMGSDYPAETGLIDPVKTIESLDGLPVAEKQQIMGGNLLEFIHAQDSNKNIEHLEDRIAL